MSILTADEAIVLTRAVCRLMQRWQVDDETAARILGISQPRFRRWKHGHYGTIEDVIVVRLSILLGIHTKLRALFADPGRSFRWMRTPNDAFGQSPLSLISDGECQSLLRLRAYVNALSQPW